jgi:hypothetical protein
VRKPPPKSPLTPNETRTLFLLFETGGLTESQLASCLKIGQTWAENILKFQLLQRDPPLVIQEDAPSGHKRGRPPKLYKINPLGITVNPFTWLVLWERYHHLEQPALHRPSADIIAMRIYGRLRYLADIDSDRFIKLHLYLKEDAIPMGYIAEPYPTCGDDIIHLTPRCSEHMPFIDLMALFALSSYCTDLIQEMLGASLHSFRERLK